MFNLYFDCSARNNHHYTDLKVCSHCLLFAIEIGHGKEGCGHEFSTVMPSFFFFNICNNNPCYSEFDMASSNVLVIIKQQQFFFFRANGYKNKRGKS